MLVAGVDGCPRGWITVIATSEDGLKFEQALVLPSFKDVLAATNLCAAVAVDIPIGLSDNCPRLADRAARRLLGRPRASSVFPAPVRGVLRALDYASACALSQAACGRSLSRQAFNICAKIKDADDALLPSDQRRVREAHPEVSFTALNAGVAMLHNKKTLEGRAARAAILCAIFGDDFARLSMPHGAARDDLYDAGVLAWTAARVARGEAQSLPAEPEYDARGLRMEIVY
jgi:predicted RNase H-like nuclease